MEAFRTLKLKQLIFSLIACTFIPTLIVVVYSYWQKLVRVIGEMVVGVPIIALFWNILQIGIALAILLGVAWIIRKLMSYLRTEHLPYREIDSGNLGIAIFIAFACSLVIVGVSGIFSNPVMNIVRILLSFIDDPSVTSVTDHSYLPQDYDWSPMKASVMTFTNIALFCWTAYWSFTFILGIVEDIRGRIPNTTRAKARQFMSNRHYDSRRQVSNEGLTEANEKQATPSPSVSEPVDLAAEDLPIPPQTEQEPVPDSPLLNRHLTAGDNRLRALVEAKEKAEQEQTD